MVERLRRHPGRGRSNAGKFGTIMLYVGLAMGIFGFLIKVIITWLLENAGV